MIPASDEFKIACGGTHVMAPRVTAYYGGQAQGYVTITDGRVQYDESNDVQGSVSLKIPCPERVSDGVFDPREIDVNGWRLFIEYGVRLPSGFEYLPLGSFVVYDINDDDSDVLNVRGYDTTVLLRDARFVAPYPIAAGQNYATALAALVTDAGLTSSFPSTSYTTPVLLFQEGDDRYAKMRDMGTSLGWSIVSDVDVNGTIIARVDATPISTNVALNFVEGQGSKMVSLSRRRTRSQVYNIAVVTGEPAGQAPVYAISYDDDPNSPTYYLGPFGRVPVFEKSQYITTTAQAQVAADALKLRKKGFGTSLQITTWPHPWLRPGDPVQVTRARMSVDQIVPLKSVSVPLVAGQDMNVTTREGQFA